MLCEEQTIVVPRWNLIVRRSTMGGQVVADSDMAGPLLIALLLGVAMLLRGKVVQS